MRRDPAQIGLGGLGDLPSAETEARALWRLVESGRASPAEVLALVEVPPGIEAGLREFAATEKRAGRSVLRALDFRAAVLQELQKLTAESAENAEKNAGPGVGSQEAPDAQAEVSAARGPPESETQVTTESRGDGDAARASAVPPRQTNGAGG